MYWVPPYLFHSRLQECSLPMGNATLSIRQLMAIAEVRVVARSYWSVWVMLPRTTITFTQWLKDLLLVIAAELQLLLHLVVYSKSFCTMMRWTMRMFHPRTCDLLRLMVLEQSWVTRSRSHQLQMCMVVNAVVVIPLCLYMSLVLKDPWVT